MFSIRSLALTSMICVVAAGAARADDPPVFSGPQVGEMLSPLNVVFPYGEHRGEQVDFVKVADGKPIVLLVVNGVNRPTGSMSRAVMHWAEMGSSKDLFAGVVMLAEDRSESEKFLLRTCGALALGSPLGISVDGSEGPGSYGFNRNVNVTVIVAKNNRVTANFALVQPSPKDYPKIFEEIINQAGGTMPSESEMQFLSSMSLPEKRLPFPLDSLSQQVELRKRFCAFLAAADKADEAQVDAAAKEVEAYVAKNAEVRDQFAHAVELNSPSNRYYTPIPPSAARHIERWYEAVGNKDGDKTRMRAPEK